MKLNTVMGALKNAEKIHQEQQAFWDMFDEVWPADKPKSVPEDDYCLHDEIDEIIFEKVVEALKECNHNRTHTANKLGIKRETLLAKMKKYCLL
jgi:DNA-binding NtrC family response regulator